MKVAYISTPWFADIDICYLSEAQKLSNVDYYLVIYNNTQATAINIDSKKYRPGIRSAKEIPELKRFEQLLDLNSFWILNIQSNHSVSIQALWGHLLLFFRLIRKRYDIIHFTRPFSLLTLFYYFLRKKMVFTVHDPIEHSGHIDKRVLIEKSIAINRVRHYILLNRVQVTDFIRRYNIDINKKKIHLSGLSCYSYLKMFPTEEIIKGRYILYFGSINKYKGLDVLFPAMERVLRIHQNVKLVVAGKGSFDFDIFKYTSDSRFIILNKFIPDNELASLISGSEFVVAPYHDATQSGVVMTAFALNKPCVVTNVGALPEMVVNDFFGKVIEPNNIEELADTMIGLLNAPEVLTTFSNNIESAYGEGLLSWKHVAEDLADVYNDISNS